MLIDLLALHKLGVFDIVLDMDWLTRYYATIDCKSWTVMFRELGHDERGDIQRAQEFAICDDYLVYQG